VEENNCGIYVDPESPSQLAEKLVELKNNPELLKQMGLNSRKLAETEYDRSILCDQFAAIVNGMDNELPRDSAIDVSSGRKLYS
jgi:glycosyltransferase involved in cell wall biosynthesis